MEPTARPRRLDREITDRGSQEKILELAKVCRLAFRAEPAPYIVPLNFGFEWKNSLRLYFHGARQGSKMDLMRQDNRVGFEMDLELELVRGPEACDWGMAYQSLVGWGRIKEAIGREEKIHGLDLLMAHYGYGGKPMYSDASLEATAVLVLEVERMTGKGRGFT